MENDTPFLQADDGRSSRRGRLMGKLFGGKDRKAPEAESAANLDAFLRSSSDHLRVTDPPPPPPPQTAIPKLTKLDTTIARFPQAVAINQQAQQNRPLAPGQHQSSATVPTHVSRPNKKGLVVHFADSYPEIIGEGGDEAETPTVEVSRKKTARRSIPPSQRRPVPTNSQPPARAPSQKLPPRDDDFVPKPLGRTQTGYSSIYEPESSPEAPPVQSRRSTDQGQVLMPGRAAPARFLETTGRSDENRRSFIEIHQAQMREAEGQAFAQAARVTSPAATEHEWEEDERAVPDANPGPVNAGRQGPVSPMSQSGMAPVDYSPAASISSLGSNSMSPTKGNMMGSAHSQNQAPWSMDPPSSNAPPSAARLQEAMFAPSEDALSIFVSRTKHLFELFRLHAETAKPLRSCTLKDCSRASLWWFLYGRMRLEAAVRERPTSPQSQMQAEMDRQQAYTDLAKGYWLSEEIIPEIADTQQLPPDAEVIDIAKALLSGLGKLSISMQRNGFLPPEEAVLPQTIDKSIWVEYPPLSQDVTALLTGNWASGMTAMQHPMSALRLLDAFPVADTSENFSYGRFTADVFLMEQGRESQRLHFPCLLSVVRPQSQTGLVFMLASQNGSVQLAIQENRNAGPVWDDVRWRNDTCTLDVRLPRGFALAVQLIQQDFRTLWNMYEFGSKVKATMYPRNDESIVFRNTLRSFQYIDADPQSRVFPKDPVPHCDVAMFEKILQESSPAGLRIWHCGFRIAVATGTHTRTLSGVHHAFPPSMPVQFGFFRAESEAPALSLKFETGRQKGRMVMVFNDEKERIRFHSLLTGTALNHDEKIFADLPLKNFLISQSLREPTGMAPFNRMPWKAVRVINEEMSAAGGEPTTVLSDRLRLVYEYGNGTVTERVNVAPGELRMRLEVTNAKIFRILRQSQQDVTIAVSEVQVPKELPRNMVDALQLLMNNQTIRTLEFANLRDLHAFQLALTGFEVVFDGLAATFGITRRRMVVPIHKKWEAGFTRVQVVKSHEGQLQLLVFFEDFHHGHCMNFVLKGTDTYETFGKGAKSGVRFVDAKFPLPRVPADKDGDYDDMAFVCLDLPDLPGEHDDISIVFEREDDRDKLCQCLPSPVSHTAKLASRLK